MIDDVVYCDVEFVDEDIVCGGVIGFEDGVVE